ncbi:MAG: hypothetical protein LBU81_05150 [Methanosarcinales archaeon]|jgi:uncharacterized membrane protein|nr:hypothetical protein [Methanosarcinales archaeon]
MDFDIITSSLGKGWETFKDNIVAFVVAPILMIVAMFVAFMIVTVLGGGLTAIGTATGSGALTGGLFLISMLLALIIMALVVLPFSLSMYYMAVKGLKGEKVEIGDVFYSFKSNFVKNLIFLIIYMVIIGVLSLIPLIGSLIALILFSYSPFIFLADPSKGPIYAITESFNVAKDNLVMTIVAIIVYSVLVFIGCMLLGIGLLVTLPIAYVFLAAVLKELKPGIV